MITAVFFRRGGALRGFRLSGHSDYGSAGNDVVCAAVSSAVMLTCNTVTEFLKIPADVGVEENLITLRLKNDDSAARLVIESLHEHLSFIKEEYGSLTLTIQEE